MPCYCLWSKCGTDRRWWWQWQYNLMIQEPDVATHLGHCPLQSIVRLWDVWCVILWMFSADSRLSRLTLFPVYLHYPGSGCSLALDSRHNLSGWLWVLMRTPPWHDHLLVITQAQPVITRDSLCSHTISLCPPSRVTTSPLIGQETHSSPLIGLMSCVSRMRPELLQMTQITGPDASLVTRRAWPGPEREVMGGEVRWPMRERRVASSEQWGNPGLGPVQAGSSPASAGENISSARQISRWRMFSEKICRLWIKFLVSSMDVDIYFSSFTG